MRTDSLPKIDRRFDRRMYDFIYISGEEIKERGLPGGLKLFDKLVYNGELHTVRALTTAGGVLTWRHGQRGPL